MKVKRVSEKYLHKVVDKIKFSEFVKSLLVDGDGEQNWRCCQLTFIDRGSAYKHVSVFHLDLVKGYSDETVHSKVVKREDCDSCLESIEITDFETKPVVSHTCTCDGAFVVLLYYYYTNLLGETHNVERWQRQVCTEFKLIGKIRIADEGINGTVEGCDCSTEKYIQAMLNYRLFSNMLRTDFKKSTGNGCCFDDLKVGIHSELCTLGITPQELKPAVGNHLSPEEFHQKLREKEELSGTGASKEPLLLDCRNFYESKIGYFDGAVKPDLRKFSYFTEYVDKNQELFNNREILTYCTGGIRCERASAYVKQATNCSNVFQLKGGIHKYLEQYPDSELYKGKLFVFDNRYGISIGDSDRPAVSNCFFCPAPCDKYELCSTAGCCQLVLICEHCRESGITTCCDTCAQNAKLNQVCKQCRCTVTRERATTESL
ncbi:thiosulfate sulfurtransferase/rhodanese-like domain-containing protein 2 [Ciona intestinalis]